MYNCIMSKESAEQPTTKSFSRKACLEDFFDITSLNKHNYNQNCSHNSNIAKNQQEFGHKKRIKP
jgi:hypothetical protein